MGFFEVCVSEDLLGEIERVLIEVKGLAAEKAKIFTQAVTSNSAQVVANAQYIELASSLTGPDPDDLLHLAAAKLKKPYRSPTEILDGLEVCGLIETVKCLRS
jgi:hypothetical protein